jgi:UPF0716 protein FxsA
MPILILLVLLCIPIAEIAVFIKAGQVIGLGWTLALVVLTAMLGTALLRRQGLRTLTLTQQKLDRGELPVGELFDGLCLLAAGALLLTPGFITDIIGLTLFIPPIRKFLGTAMLRAILRGRNTRFWVNGEEVAPRGGPIIDGDYTDVTGGSNGDGRSGRIGHRPGPDGTSPWHRPG